MSEFKECPFCGRDGEMERRVIDASGSVTVWGYYIYCHPCGASGPLELSEKDATEKWNHRVTGDY